MRSQFVAFLRGINVGGNTKVSMEVLKSSLEKEGFFHTRTVLNSGNIIFESVELSQGKIKKIIEDIIEKNFGFHSDVIVHFRDVIRRLVQENPFKNINITSQTRLYVTFLAEPHENSLVIPYGSSEKDFTILQAMPTEICWVVVLSKAQGTTEAMKFIEKTYGKKVTTRNWNTVQKIAQLL